MPTKPTGRRGFRKTVALAAAAPARPAAAARARLQRKSEQRRKPRV